MFIKDVNWLPFKCHLDHHRFTVRGGARVCTCWSRWICHIFQHISRSIMFILAKILKRTDSSCLPKSLNFPFFPGKCISGIIFEFCMYIWTRAYNYMYITDTAACNPEKSWRTEIRYLWPITFLYIISFEISYT